VTWDGALEFASADDFGPWLAKHSADTRELWVIIFKKSTGKQRVTFDDLLDVALCWGWVDVQTKTVDSERYGIRFVPRKPKSDWSVTNRSTVCRLIAAGRMREPGTRVLPPDLVCEK
jgi:uncharacterized protein YdeI (YjbR/CyaY-like superfamily)